ncbi:hypothetical protein MPSEU_000453900 [Mayamaea pseudoterrestris]|nr:hypothetical protein MPSEU_000453900 [Mayamaea pseudoterrestris]
MATPPSFSRIRSTPQTLTLGAGGDDDKFVQLEPHGEIKESNTISVKFNSTSASWWLRRTLRNQQEDVHKKEDCVIDVDEQSISSSRRRRKKARSYMQVELQEQRHRDLDQSLLGQEEVATPVYLSASMTSTNNMLANLDSNHDNAPLSLEEKLQQSCSFFYQSMDASKRNQRPCARFRTLLNDSQQYHQECFYRDAVDVLSPPVLTHYRATYQRLNQELEPTSSERASPRNRPACDAADYDLRLDHADQHENDAAFKLESHHQSSSASMVSDSVQRSSLLYQHCGRILLKLPQDHVRLIMDADLPVGTLSVCQWRNAQEKEDYDCSSEYDAEQALPRRSTKVNAGSNQPLQHDQSRKRRRPSLHYILTVPDDLYCKVVNDMSKATKRSFFNLGICNTHDHDHADVRIAVFIMMIVMVILLVVGAAFGDG